MRYQLEITGMTCNHCRLRVKRALAALPGVIEVEVDLDAGTARVTTDGDADIGDRLTGVIDAEGYGVSVAAS